MDEEEIAELRRCRARRHHYDSDEDVVSDRTFGRRDYDRLLYTPYFHRLSAVTQVVATTTETALIHNRMTHSLKVAQLSRELAETLVRNTDAELLATLGGLCPDVSAAAGLAHDLGHPPFGHIGEQQLDKALLSRDILEGYDGNAQTFRIVTLLGAKKKTILDKPGLDLSAATRNAVLKYPISYEEIASVSAANEGGNAWTRETRPTNNDRPKFGYYSLDSEEYDLARQPHRLGASSQSLECQIMDLCDDISYAVHDLEDFIRTGVITTATLASPPRGFESLIKGRIRASLERMSYVESETARLGDEGWTLATGLLSADEEVFRPLQDPYRGTTEQQASLSALSSFYIETFLAEVSIQEGERGSELFINEEHLATIIALKNLVRELVINKPSVQLAQVGQRRVLDRVFEGLSEWLLSVEDPQHYPGLLAHIWQVNYRQARRKWGSDAQAFRPMIKYRTTADFIASLTEVQLMAIDRQLTGNAENPVLGDWII